MRRFGEKLEKYRSTEVFQKQNEAIQNLGQEHKELIADQKGNLDFFAFMAHELRTPFHGVLGSLEAMKEDPTIANNQLLNQAYMCGKVSNLFLGGIMTCDMHNLLMDCNPSSFFTIMIP